MPILSQSTNTVNKKLTVFTVFTYVYFFVTEVQESSKYKDSHLQLKNFTSSYLKKAYIISR